MFSRNAEGAKPQGSPFKNLLVSRYKGQKICSTIMLPRKVRSDHNYSTINETKNLEDTDAPTLAHSSEDFTTSTPQSRSEWPPKYLVPAGVLASTSWSKLWIHILRTTVHYAVCTPFERILKRWRGKC